MKYLKENNVFFVAALILSAVTLFSLMSYTFFGYKLLSFGIITVLSVFFLPSLVFVAGVFSYYEK